MTILNEAFRGLYGFYQFIAIVLFTIVVGPIAWLAVALGIIDPTWAQPSKVDVASAASKVVGLNLPDDDKCAVTLLSGDKVHPRFLVTGKSGLNQKQLDIEQRREPHDASLAFAEFGYCVELVFNHPFPDDKEAREQWKEDQLKMHFDSDGNFYDYIQDPAHYTVIRAKKIRLGPDDDWTKVDLDH